MTFIQALQPGFFLLGKSLVNFVVIGRNSPLSCHFYTLSNPELNSSFVLSIKLKLEFKQRYEIFTQNT
jgi:hypothetical protein